MPRILPLALLLLASGAAAPALAQTHPDTTDAHRYLPLDDGNVWEYRVTGLFGRLERRAVEGDTLVDGQLYARYRVTHYDPATLAVTFDHVWPLRFDTTTARLRTTPGEDELPGLTPCPLDADFGAVGVCPGGCLNSVEGGPFTVTIGPDVFETVLKQYDAEACEVIGQYVPDVGLYSFLTFFNRTALAYALVGGVEYGAPVVVAGEPPAAPVAGLSVRVRPNPSVGPVALEVTSAAPGPLTVEVFDALGRRVYGEPVAVAAGPTTLALDGARWPRGVYVVRVTAADGARATARLVRR